jgi:predicted O-methyltransferase YrrM
MSTRRRLFAACLAALLASPVAARPAPRTQAEPARPPDVPYEPTPPNVLGVMLTLADVRAGDVVYDLGCGDGRVVIAAVKKAPGVRGVCVDIDPQRIREARSNAAAQGVADRIEFRTEDLFETKISDATVVMLFLWPEINLKLRPRLERELRPGTRIVSHWHDMGDWEPEQRISVTASARPRPVFLWTIPVRSGPPGSF